MTKRGEYMLAMSQSFVGAIHSSMRAITIKIVSNHILVKVYYDHTPNEDDDDDISIVVAEFVSKFKYDEFEDVNWECVFSEGRLNRLKDPDETFIFLRKEAKSD